MLCFLSWFSESFNVRPSYCAHWGAACGQKTISGCKLRLNTRIRSPIVLILEIIPNSFRLFTLHLPWRGFEQKYFLFWLILYIFQCFFQLTIMVEFVDKLSYVHIHFMGFCVQPNFHILVRRKIYKGIPEPLFRSFYPICQASLLKEVSGLCFLFFDMEPLLSGYSSVIVQRWR